MFGIMPMVLSASLVLIFSRTMPVMTRFESGVSLLDLMTTLSLFLTALFPGIACLGRGVMRLEIEKIFCLPECLGNSLELSSESGMLWLDNLSFLFYLIVLNL